MTLSEVYFYPTDVHGTVLRLPSHRAVQWLANPHHEEGRWRTLRHHVTETDICFDIGAEQGDLSALLASWVPGGGVVLVEPNEKAWPCIAATFEENGLTSRVRACYLGLLAATDGENWADGVETGTYGTPWPDCVHHEVIDPAAGMVQLAQQTTDFPTITLDELAATVARDHDDRPNVLNIDVEGAELEVLRGAAHVLTHDRPVIALSVHPELLAHWWQATTADVLNLLAGYDYRSDLVWADHELHYVCVPS